MANPTPGPWRVSARLSASENHHGYSVLHEQGGLVADVMPWDRDGAIGAANARLIAAAPDLLAACLSMLRGNWRTNECGETCNYVDGHQCSEATALLNAVAKARGQEVKA